MRNIISIAWSGSLCGVKVVGEADEEGGQTCRLQLEGNLRPQRELLY